MCNESDLDRLRFCLEKISDIEEYLNRYPDAKSLVSDKMGLDAALMCILQIGEALSGLKEPEMTSRLPIRGIKGMRNIIAHRYHVVSPLLIAESIKTELPELKQTIQQILEKSTKSSA